MNTMNGFVINLCHPLRNEHVWLWAGNTTNYDFPPDLLCSCGAIRWKNRDHPEKELGDDVLQSLKEAGLYGA